MHDGVRRLSILLIVCCLALIVTFWARGSREDYGLFHLLRGETAPVSSNRQPPIKEPSPEKTTTAVTLPPAGRMALLDSLSQAQADLAEAVQPAVVSIETRKEITYKRIRRPDEEFVVPEQSIPGQGSGVIIREEGYVVTNHHVIDGADDVTVMTHQGEQFPCMVIGEDRVTDIAVLRIEVEPDHKFPTLPWGDSDEVRQGNIVFSVGSPFGLEGTFTNGIINSARPRRISDSSPPLFQTNTVLNRGNSGGPLINVRGEVIGINRAIFNRGPRDKETGQAYGLAIPSNDARRATNLIFETGNPLYGYLGVYLRELSLQDGLALRLRDLEGCLVTGVLAGSPAYRSGLQRDDVIQTYAGEPVTSVGELVYMIQDTDIGTEAKLEIVRGGQEMVIRAMIQNADAVAIPEPTADQVAQGWEISGLEVRYVRADERRQKGYEAFVSMVEITKVRPASPAENAGLLPGFLVHQLDDFPVDTPELFYKHLIEAADNEQVSLIVSPPESPLFGPLQLPLS